MRSRMAGKSILYCSPSFIVATRLLAAMIASGDGVCADAAKVKQRKLPAMINKRLLTCPVALYPATSDSEKVSFNQINRKTGHRIKYAKGDADTGEAVYNDDIMKGYK